MKEKTIFDFLNSIYTKNHIQYDKKICSAYLLSMWLSHDKQLVDIVNEINEFQFFLPDHMIYEYYYHKIPMGKRFIRWVKKDEVDKKKKEKTDEIRKEMMLSKREMDKFKSFNLTSDTKSGNVKKKSDNASKIFL